MKQKISITLNEKILRDVDSIVDNLIIRNRSQAIEHLIIDAFKESKVAVILAGDGRNRPEKDRNRFSLKINNSPIIERAVRKLSDSGFRHVFIVSDKENLTKIFNILGDGSKYKSRVEYIEEEIQEGTGSAIKLLKNKIKVMDGEGLKRDLFVVNPSNLASYLNGEADCYKATIFYNNGNVEEKDVTCKMTPVALSAFSQILPVSTNLQQLQGGLEKELLA